MDRYPKGGKNDKKELTNALMYAVNRHLSCVGRGRDKNLRRIFGKKEKQR